jgi:uncharacterized membrane protein
MSLFKTKPLLPHAAQTQVVAAIREAEQKTTGEVRVYMEARCTHADALVRAAQVFSSLKMEQTAHRNAVLVYLAIKDKKFAIYGDAAAFQALGPDYWETAAATLHGYLRKGLVAEGLAACVQDIGNLLAQHFPFDALVNKNELPDEIVFGKQSGSINP